MGSKKKKQKHSNLCVCNDCKIKNSKELKHADNCPCISCGKKIGKSTYTWDCHKGNVPIFEKDGVTILGGGSFHDAEPKEVDIVLDLANNVPSSWESFIPDGWKSKSLTWGPTVIYLTIKDHNAPSKITKEFWAALWEDLKTQAPCRVLVMCLGGHGRTGLVLTCLMMAAKFDVGDINPIRWLRDHYCEKIIESQVQLEYVGDMWDIAVKRTTTSYTPPYHSGGGYSKSYDNSGYNSSDDAVCHKGCGYERGEVIFDESTQLFECLDCWGERTSYRVEYLQGSNEEKEANEKKGGNIREEQLHRMTDTQYAASEEGYYGFGCPQMTDEEEIYSNYG